MKLFTIAAVSFGTVQPAYSMGLTVRNVIELTNRERSLGRLPILHESSELSKAAQAKAEDMLVKGYFAHNAPDGRTPWDFIQEAGYGYMTAGENLAVNFTDAETATEAWMNSPSHKANILGRNYEETGVGIATGQYHGRQATFVVQMFGTQAEQRIVLSETPGNETEAVPVVPSGTVAIGQADAQVADDVLKVSVRVAGDPVKVLARFGPRAAMLEPRGDGLWEATIELEKLAEEGKMLLVRAFAMDGSVAQQKLAEFAPPAWGQAARTGLVAGASTNVLGVTFDPKSLEHSFYLFFMAGVMACLAMAIGIKAQIQHLGLIANSSFVVMLGAFLWMAG